MQLPTAFEWIHAAFGDESRPQLSLMLVITTLSLPIYSKGKSECFPDTDHHSSMRKSSKDTVQLRSKNNLKAHYTVPPHAQLHAADSQKSDITRFETVLAFI